MSTYVIQKKTECDWCDDGNPPGLCSKCHGTGYIYEQVDFLEVLKKVQWPDPVSVYRGMPTLGVSVRLVRDDAEIKE
jgi:hypothetical protein